MRGRFPIPIGTGRAQKGMAKARGRRIEGLRRTGLPPPAMSKILSAWQKIFPNRHGSKDIAAVKRVVTVTAVLGGLRKVLLSVALFSCVINILALTGSLFMLQVYDRVLPSQSVPTLVALTILIAILFAFQACLDVIRSRLLVRMASRLDESLGEHVYRSVLTLPLHTVPKGDGLQPVRDLDMLRNFFSGPGPVALFDLPWIPIYLAFVYMLHPQLGLLATSGALVLLALTLFTEIATRRPSREAAGEAQRRHALTTEGFQNAEVLQSMGFADRLIDRWRAVSASHLQSQQTASDAAGGYGAVAKVFRNFLQSAILALGAYLVIKGEVSGGAIIASSITSSRALGPIDVAIGQWKSFVGARQSGARLQSLLRSPIAAIKDVSVSLPAPKDCLVLENVAATAPGLNAPLIQNMSFELKAGQGLGIIGPSAAGKSTMLRAIVGAWPIVRGSVRLDGATLDQWNPSALGRHIGHLPQGVELFDGTIAENIARFDRRADPAAVLAAAQAANVHDMIVRLPEGYETRIGLEGTSLSSGQRQRIGLARAFYGNPFLIVLDEPSANLDAAGEDALTQAIHNVRDRGGIIIVVTHRPSAIAALNFVAMINDGKLQYFGPKEDVLRRVLRPAADPSGSLPPGEMVLPERAHG
jgi:PrtD family type I secretion system ABC transporter